MLTHILVLTLPVLLFASQLVLISVGRRYRRMPHDETSNAALAPIIGTVLSLMGLVLAFSFSDAAGRLDANRKTILDEANAIEGVYLSINLVDPAIRPGMNETFRRYVDSRIRAYETYEERMGRADYDREVQLSAQLFTQLWGQAIAGTTDSVGRALLLNALGAASSTATARTLAMNTHLPPAIDVFLFGIVLVGALLVGGVLAQSSRPSWFYRVVFSAVLSWTLFAIMDMEYPRLGAFQLLRNADALLVELRHSMK